MGAAFRRAAGGNLEASTEVTSPTIGTCSSMRPCWGGWRTRLAGRRRVRGKGRSVGRRRGLFIRLECGFFRGFIGGYWTQPPHLHTLHYYIIFSRPLPMSNLPSISRPHDSVMVPPALLLQVPLEGLRSRKASATVQVHCIVHGLPPSHLPALVPLLCYHGKQEGQKVDVYGRPWERKEGRCVFLA